MNPSEMRAVKVCDLCADAPAIIRLAELDTEVKQFVCKECLDRDFELVSTIQ